LEGNLVDTVIELSDRIRSKYPSLTPVYVCLIDNEHERPERIAEDQWRTWPSAVEAGRNYLVGSGWGTTEYIRVYTEPTPTYLREACRFAFENPQQAVQIDTPRLRYIVHRRGEYVEIELPFHNHGGEKTWKTLPPFKSRLLVNVD